VRQGLSFTTAGSCDKAWPIGVVEKTRSDTRPHGLPAGGGTGVAAHPVAQLAEQVIPARPLKQTTHGPHHPRTHTFHTIYDGENKQVEVRDASDNVVGQYLYNGDGQRVKKIVPATGEVTVFVHDAAGKQIAEYSTEVASGSDAKVAYLTNDHLGSPRINTDQTGAVNARHDYHPFGEEISTQARSTSNGYQGDSVKQKFTGKQRDAESGLDYFEARYYSSNLGRFVNPDEFAGGPDELFDFTDDASDNPTFYADLSVPQSLNKYQYTYNNPLNMTDDDGHDPCCGQRTGSVLRFCDFHLLIFKRGIGTGRILDHHSPTSLAENRRPDPNLFSESVCCPLVVDSRLRAFTVIAVRRTRRP
jgi:RHS repeat-associated protein